MKNQENVQTVERKKIISILMLTMTSILISISGATFSIFSLVNNINFTVFNAKINGSIFGMVIIFLGVRYFLSVRKLKAEVYKSTSSFSWSNFKKEKSGKALFKKR